MANWFKLATMGGNDDPIIENGTIRWPQSKLNRKYELHPEPFNENLGWVKRHVAEFVAQVKREVLPKLQVFNDFQVHFAQNTGKLGRYIKGTARTGRPAIVVDINACVEVCIKYRADLDTAIETTIMHELGHAVQEAKGISQNEKEAESFAHTYWQKGQVIQFRSKPKTAAINDPDEDDEY